MNKKLLGGIVSLIFSMGAHTIDAAPSHSYLSLKNIVSGLHTNIFTENSYSSLLKYSKPNPEEMVVKGKTKATPPLKHFSSANISTETTNEILCIQNLEETVKNEDFFSLYAPYLDSAISNDKINSENVARKLELEVVQGNIHSMPQPVFAATTIDYSSLPVAHAAAIGDTFDINSITYKVTSITPNTVEVSGFDFNSGITVISIPSTVTEPACTGSSCDYSVTAIGANAFLAASVADAQRITGLTLPNSVTTIGNSAFRGNKIAALSLHEGLISIGNGAFNGNLITSVDIPNSLTTLGGAAFIDNQLTSVNIGSGLTAIEASTFKNNKLENIVIPNTVTSMTGVGQAFANNLLTNVTLSNALTTLPNLTFSNNQLVSVTIPSSVTTMGRGVFYQNSTLTTVISKSTTPPTIFTDDGSQSANYDTFGGTGARGAIDLIIPNGTKGAYVDNTGALWTGFKSVAFIDTPPTATAVSFSGTLTEGRTLTGSYTYGDTDGTTGNNAESGTTFKWYRSNDASGTGKAAITGATNSTYELTSDDVGKFISFEVTPKNTNATGTAVESAINSTTVIAETFLAQNALMVTRLDITNKYIEFVNIDALPAGTVIKITDKGWTVDGTTRKFTGNNFGDGIITWTVGTTIAAGHVFKLFDIKSTSAQLTQVTNSNTDLTSQLSFIGFTGTTTAATMITQGEQWFFYQGAAEKPYFLFGINASTSPVTTGSEAGWNTAADADNNTTYESVRPTTGTYSQNSLENSVSAVAFPTAQKDIVAYTGPVTGASRAIWVARILNLTNWTADDTTVTGKITEQLSFDYAEWTGAGSNDWNTASNWASGTVPTATDHANIPSGKTVVLNGTGTCKNLTLETNATLTVNPAGKLTIESDLAQNGTLNIESNASSHGTLILKGSQTGTQKVTYKKYLTTAATGADGWHLIAAPVKNKDIADFYTLVEASTNPATRRAIGVYNNDNASGSKWVYFDTNANPAPGNFISGQGYAIKKKSTDGNGSLDFTGLLHTDNAGVSIGVVTGSAGHPFNVIGNPYTAYVNASTFLGATGTDLTEQTIWIWDSATKKYVTKNLAATYKLAPGEAFFVSAASATNVTFTKANQEHAASARTQLPSHIKLAVSNTQSTEEASIYYLENATTGFDNGYDSSIFEGVAQNFVLYTQTVANDTDRKLAIQSLPNTNYENMVVPIGVKTSANEQITFSAENMNLPSGVSIFLEDKQTQQFTQLDNNNRYRTTPSEDLNGTGRFYLHTRSGALSNDSEVETSNIAMYKLNNSTLRVTGLAQETGSIALINIQGKQVFSKTIEATNGTQDVTLPTLSQGVYIARLTMNNKNLSRKIIIE